MAKTRCLKKSPIVVLERLPIKTEIITRSNKELARTKHKNNACLGTQKNTKTSAAFIRRKRKRAVDLKKNDKAASKVELFNHIANKHLLDQKFYPKVVLERISVDNTKKYLSAKEDVTVLEKSDDSCNQTNCVYTPKKIRKCSDNLSTESCQNSINKENFTSNISNQESNKHNSVSINEENTSIHTKSNINHQVQKENKSNEENNHCKDACADQEDLSSVNKENEIDIITVDDENINNKKKVNDEKHHTHGRDENNDPLNINVDEFTDCNLDVIQDCQNLQRHSNNDDLSDMNGKNIDSNDAVTENLLNEEKSADYDYIINDDSNSAFSPSEGNSHDIITTETSPTGVQDKTLPIKHNFFISLKDAFESISADMNHLDEALCSYEASKMEFEEDSRQVEEEYIEESPEIFHLSNNSDSRSADTVIDQNKTRVDYGSDTITSIIERRLNFFRQSQPLNTKSSDQSSNSTSDENNHRKRISIRVARCPKCKKVFTGFNFPRHWEVCRIGPYISCNFCDNKFKQKRSLVSHMKKHHSKGISEEDIHQIVENCYLLGKATLEKIKELPTEMMDITIPNFVRVYCKLCFTTYTSLPANYRQVCHKCSKVLSYHCNRCHGHQLTSHLMAKHLRGECQLNEDPLYDCSDCELRRVRDNLLENQREQSSGQTKNVNQQNVQFCHRCGRELYSRNAMVKHRRHCGRDANLSCKFCPYKTKHRSVIMVHMQQHVINKDKPIISDDKIILIGKSSIFSKSGNVTAIVSSSQKQEQERVINSKIYVYCPRCKENPGSSLEFRYSTCNSCIIPYHFQCQDCLVVYTSYCLVNYHVARKHAPKIYSCSMCRKLYSFEPDYLNHMENCKRQTLLTCEECPYSTRVPRNLQNHQLRRHPQDHDLKYVCDHCPMRFSLAMSKKQHMSHCGREPGLGCAHCAFRTHSKYSLRRHIQSQHAAEIFAVQFTCEFCNKIFFNIFCFESHVQKCSLRPDMRDIL